MHLLAATPGAITDGEEAIDLQQSPGDIVFLSAADTELLCLAKAHHGLHNDYEDCPSLRLSSLLHLGHNMSVDLFVEQTLEGAKLIIVRLLGGKSYWDYGVEELVNLCRTRDIQLVLLPGDDKPDHELATLSTLKGEGYHRLWQYCIHGGPDNARELLRYSHSLLGLERNWREPVALAGAGLYWPGMTLPSLDDLQKQTWHTHRAKACLVFYRALFQAGNLKAVDALIESLQANGLDPVPVFVNSLKDPLTSRVVEDILEKSKADIVLNATGFALSSPNAERTQTPFDKADCPVLQVIFSGGNVESWQQNTNGLNARDIAMNVALPEVDGRLLSRAVSFKGLAERDDLTECDLVTYQPVLDRVDFTARLAANWVRLRTTPKAERTVALVLANYPNRDGRIGNGVGLDTPQAALEVLQALHREGYDLSEIPKSGNDLVKRLQIGATNDFSQLQDREIAEYLPLTDYQAYFQTLPEQVKEQVLEKWGEPEQDPFCLKDGFALPAYRLGQVAVCLQPARGYNIDPVETYHSPDLVPPHNYLAFYAWLNKTLNVHAVIHMGKHGNLEWLPGKSLALSETCFPEAVFGPQVNLYPFIINDPGEGTQAKRRTQAVIIDHLTPPLTRAESYGPLRDLEQLVDEYFEAASVDPRRLKVLKRDILSLARRTGLDEDCKIAADEDDETAFAKLDNHLCELKEMQIRDGLHIFGQSPEGGLLDDLLVALVRVDRGDGLGKNASLIRALSKDLALNFDPLDCSAATLWEGPRPDSLLTLCSDAWRTEGDTLERLEMLASKLISADLEIDPNWACSKPVLDYVLNELKPIVSGCGKAEIEGLMTGLDGRFVLPGPSGAPTRARPDILPTGRNFYSVDTRTVPTPAAWTLGWKSASLMVERYLQDHGDWPRTMALSCWGTSNMRTGGDDIAQALALLGVQPTWDSLSRRLTGFEIMPQSVLGRPRVDVTLRISGFFRDAFPGLIDLFDSAVRAVAGLEEPFEVNPIKERVNEEKNRLMETGLDELSAERQAGFRVFGAKPGAYGAGLQALIDEKGWQDTGDLAEAYLSWGGYAYGQKAEGQAAHDLFKSRLSKVEAVIQNQDNREHDLLDSDDYYQFEGGLHAAVETFSGASPTVYHNDHSRPETPRIRTLDEEIARVVRARCVNPKWIDGVKRHGYKGAFEMAASLDYLFAFAATTSAVKGHHFDALFEAYIEDDETRKFLEDNNPDALREMLERFLEAMERELWQARSNSARFSLEGHLAALKK